MTGWISNLLQGKNKPLIGKFSIRAINLDYCNHIVGPTETSYLSSNLKDTRAIIENQKKSKCKDFRHVCYNRTDAHGGGWISKFFLGHLERHDSIQPDGNPKFKMKYDLLFGGQDPTKVLAADFTKVIPLGILKMISLELAMNGYTILDSDVIWLKRDEHERKYHLDLLHLALRIGTGAPITYRNKKRLWGIGAVNYLEGGVVTILDKIRNNQIVTPFYV